MLTIAASGKVKREDRVPAGKSVEKVEARSRTNNGQSA
jgi:hypothetical protein